MNHRLHGFTLIELLIVVAIIAILAAIAVPNFLEAQTRSKVSRVKADLRSMATAQEAYYVDNNAYPQCNNYGTPMAGGSAPDIKILERLSTPIAYMTQAILRDPFSVKTRLSAATAQAMQTAAFVQLTPADAVFASNCLIYQSWNSADRAQAGATQTARAWLLHSVGPDSNYYNLGGVLATDKADALPYTLDMMYDPTNGTVSRGSVWRIGGGPAPSATYASGEGLVKAINIANK